MVILRTNTVYHTIGIQMCVGRCKKECFGNRDFKQSFIFAPIYCLCWFMDFKIETPAPEKSFTHTSARLSDVRAIGGFAHQQNNIGPCGWVFNARTVNTLGAGAQTVEK